MAGYSVPRLTRYFGGFLRHGNAWPDRKIRLYRRGAARWVGYEVHEKIAVDGRVGRLRAPLEHHAYRSLDDHLARVDRYARLMADEMYRAGRRGSLAAVFVAPVVALRARHAHQARRARRLARLAVPLRGSRLRAPQVPAPVGAVAPAPEGRTGETALPAPALLFAAPPRAVLIVKLSAIGDVCHTLPVIRTLQRAWPATRFTWIIGRSEARLVGAHFRHRVHRVRQACRAGGPGGTCAARCAVDASSCCCTCSSPGARAWSRCLPRRP